MYNVYRGDTMLTVKEAAAALGVSDKTIRRKITKGELKAELKDSPYGKQYFIPKSEINTAQQIIEVVQVKKEYDMQELALTLANYLNERDTQLNKSIGDIKESMDSLVQQNKQLRQQVLESEEKHYRALDEKLRQIMDSKKKGFWDRFKK
jgi:excisionase family DNA binding protein